MNEDYKGFTIYSANKDGGGTFYYMDGVIFPEKYKSVAAAKGAITRHLNKTADLPEIEVVPRTQQEIDDYGPNGIQLPKSRLIALTDSYKVSHIKPCTQPAKSRNKREGGYCGHYRASDNDFKLSHHRVGPKGDYETLKERARYNKIHGL